jgi:hypothetical protein
LCVDVVVWNCCFSRTREIGVVANALLSWRNDGDTPRVWQINVVVRSFGDALRAGWERAREMNGSIMAMDTIEA